MPRVGIAWRPSEKWVIRTGGGWFDNIQHLNTFTIFNLMPPKAGSQGYQTSYVAAGTVPVNAANGQTVNVQTFKYAPGSPVLTLNDPFLTASGGSSVVRPIDVVYLPPDYKDGDVWKWSFDVQRELPWNSIASVGYAGSKASHIGNSVINWNDPVAPVAVFAQNLRPYPQFYDPARPDLGVQSTGRIRYIDSYGEGFYHGLQGRFDKRVSHGLSFGLAYTYSKSWGDGEAGGQEGASFQNPRDRRGSRGLYSFDQTHRTVANYVWDLPGRNMKGVVGTLVGGWQVNGILTIASGFPFTITQGSGDLGLPNGSVRPDVVANPNIDNPSRKQWYNPQAFQRVTCQIPSRPDLCHLGSAGYDQMRGPGQR